MNKKCAMDTFGLDIPGEHFCSKIEICKGKK